MHLYHSNGALKAYIIEGKLNFCKMQQQIGRKHTDESGKGVLLSLDQVLKIVKDAFTSATERDIYTGDFLEIFVITKSGVTKEKMDLKKD